MNNLNTVLMEGTLIRDPERSNQVTGSSQCRLSLANNRYYFGKNGKWVQDASFFTVWVSGPVAESCLKFLRKGRGIRIVGRLKQLRYSMGGFSREKVAILAEHIEFQPVKKTDETETTPPPKIPGELQTRSDSSIVLEEETAAEVPATPPRDAAPQAVPAETTGQVQAQVQVQAAVTVETGQPAAAPAGTVTVETAPAEPAPAEEAPEENGPENFEDAVPGCDDGEDMPVTDVTDAPF